MIAEYLSSLIQGRMVFITVISLTVGYTLGWTRVGPIGAIIWIAVTLFFELGLWITSPYIDALIYILETGAGPDRLVTGVMLLSLATYPTLLLLALMLGRSSRAVSDEDYAVQAAAMTPQEITGHLDVIAAHPQIGAAGWFATTWVPMSVEGKLEWVGANLSALRTLWLETPEDGLLGQGVDLPMRLATIEQQRSKP